MSAATINLILQIISALLSAGPEMVVQAQAIKAKLEQFQTEGRDPSPEEWQALLASIGVDEARIDAADARLNS